MHTGLCWIVRFIWLIYRFISEKFTKERKVRVLALWLWKRNFKLNFTEISCPFATLISSKPCHKAKSLTQLRDCFVIAIKINCTKRDYHSCFRRLNNWWRLRLSYVRIKEMTRLMMILCFNHFMKFLVNDAHCTVWILMLKFLNCISTCEMRKVLKNHSILAPFS